MKSRRILFSALLLFFFFLFIQSWWLQLASAQTICLNNGNYTLNSTYAVNLNTTFTILSRDVIDTGFTSASPGEGVDRAYALVLCGGDAQLDACRNCTRESIDELLRSCPNRKQAIRWDDRCMLRYSNASIYGVMATFPMWHSGYSNNPTSPRQFGVVFRSLLDELREGASSGGSLRKVAARSVTGPDYQAYAMVQCTPDLSREDCGGCLISAYANITAFCDGRRGCRIFLPSCTLRYELYRFYNDTRLQELGSLSLSPPAPVSSSGMGGTNTRTVMIIVAPTVLSLILAISAVVWLRKRRAQKPMGHRHDNVDEIIISTPESLQYAFSTIKSATNDFSDDNKLGQGGFGSVYKGKLPDGLEIAVKRLSMNSGQGDLEFKNEVLLLAKLQHRNLVRLFGFAIKGTEKLLIYELVQNASLDKFIFEKKSRSYLDWDRRYKIIGGIARGILYLHEDSRLRVIHRDLKASNILLDGKMIPKIADFGMARLFGEDETQQNTNRVVGTYGYMAPEYAMQGVFSVKSDVFSFGVMLLEIISGKRNHGSFHHQDHISLLVYAWGLWKQGKEGELVDPMLRGNCPMQQVERCIQIGLMCVQEDAEERPNMSQVIFFLENEVAELPHPNKPAFSAGREATAAVMLEYRSAAAFSVNQVTVSSIMPR